MRPVIPSFRLPVREVETTIDILSRLGVEFRCGEKIDLQDGLNKLGREFEAMILAVGAGPAVKPDLPGANLESVVQAIDLLRKAKHEPRSRIRGSVIVLGGGNTAVDAALVCKKLGAEKVRIVSLERRSEMPASPLALDEAVEEGIEFDPGWGATALVGEPDGRIQAELSRCLSLHDDQGRFHPVLESVCGLKISADRIVLAMGQKRKPPMLGSGRLKEPVGDAAIDPVTLQSRNNLGLFICGDALNGPSSVVHSLASGREAAISVDRFLRGESLEWDRGFWNGAQVKEYESLPNRAIGGPRCALKRVSFSERTLEIETESCFSIKEARREAERCLSCGRSFEMNKTCWFCLPCEIECPVKALEVRMPYWVR
ncbi:MAG: FAD-dependent oxidoreductase [Deltaproteobacteria bacterium]|nr:FAD-dependent oxidoreductase [Deltaproteobacteria bacterium]